MCVTLLDARPTLSSYYPPSSTLLSTYVSSMCESGLVQGWVTELNCLRENGPGLFQLSEFFSFLLECARIFHAAGAKVVLCGRNVKALEEFTRELADSSSSQVSLQQRF